MERCRQGDGFPYGLVIEISKNGAKVDNTPEGAEVMIGRANQEVEENADEGGVGCGGFWGVVCAGGGCWAAWFSAWFCLLFFCYGCFTLFFFLSGSLGAAAWSEYGNAKLPKDVQPTIEIQGISNVTGPHWLYILMGDTDSIEM
ncbi:hypothetical protein U1Q18_033640 [Sarracenia purpurea var. burkii]